MREITEKELVDCIEIDKYSESREQYVQRMVEEGFNILVPEPNELFIDIDNGGDFNRFEIAFERLKIEYGEMSADIKPSKSGLPHRHIIVKMPFNLIDPVQRIAFQVVLGSDRTREMLSLFRDRNGDPCPTLFAEEEEKCQNL